MSLGPCLFYAFQRFLFFGLEQINPVMQLEHLILLRLSNVPHMRNRGHGRDQALVVRLELAFLEQFVIALSVGVQTGLMVRWVHCPGCALLHCYLVLTDHALQLLLFHI